MWKFGRAFVYDLFHSLLGIAILCIVALTLLAFCSNVKADEFVPDDNAGLYMVKGHGAVAIVSIGHFTCPETQHRATVVTDTGGVLYGCALVGDGSITFVLETGQMFDIPITAPGHSDGPAPEKPSTPERWQPPRNS